MVVSREEGRGEIMASSNAGGSGSATPCVAARNRGMRDPGGRQLRRAWRYDPLSGLALAVALLTRNG